MKESRGNKAVLGSHEKPYVRKIKTSGENSIPDASSHPKIIGVRGLLRSFQVTSPQGWPSPPCCVLTSSGFAQGHLHHPIRTSPDGVLAPFI